MGAHVSAVPNGQTGRSVPIRTRGVVAMCGTFGYEMDLRNCTEEEKTVVREQTETFKARWRLIQEGDYYRLTDPFREGPYTAWEQVSEDRREALISVVMGTVHGALPFLTVKAKGLDPQASYRINGSTDRYTGEMLMNIGIPLPVPEGDYQSAQLYLEAR